MTTRMLQIDFVSDVVCPWCVIGLRALERGLAAASDAVSAEINFHPFELNPAMPREGQNIVEHVGEKYGSTPEQSAVNRQRIRDAAAALGFTMNGNAESRIYNTFDAHRLLHWAREQGQQAALKERLFALYFTEGGDVSDHEQLARAAEAVGLDGAETRAVLYSERYAEDVRRDEAFWQAKGISAVPSIVIDGKYLIQGGQPPEAFERALRAIAAQS